MRLWKAVEKRAGTGRELKIRRTFCLVPEFLSPRVTQPNPYFAFLLPGGSYTLSIRL
jgi:hypothetical protein